jgi:hypothetical protein
LKSRRFGGFFLPELFLGAAGLVCSAFMVIAFNDIISVKLGQRYHSS